MKTCERIILNVHGREMSFSEKELISILEKYFDAENTEQVTPEKVLNVPAEGKWVEINPQAIDESLFKEKRNDEKQEETRKLIQEALENAKSSPERYGQKFEIFIPKKTWEAKTIKELKQLACEFGNHNADWVELAMEWAYRISNGEWWESICNDIQTTKWYRLVEWKNGYDRIVGGNLNPESFVLNHDYNSFDRIFCTVPLVVRYKK